MTLNIDLEEVPFAILEAVKARIMANRRRLSQDQQQPRPSLRPRPQFVKIGASSKSWRLPKPAVMVLEDYATLLITWKDLDFVFSDPRAEQTSYDPVNIAASTLSGYAAIATDGSSFSNFGGAGATVIKPDTTGDFTLEGWAQLSSSDAYNNSSRAWLQLNWTTPEESNPNNLWPYRVVNVTGRYFPVGFNGSGLSANVAPGFYVDGEAADGYWTNPIKTPVNATSPFHLCVQRISSTYHFYANGTKFASHSVTDPFYSVMPEMITVRFYLEADRPSSPSKLGQMRLTVNQARYSESGFTPDPLPFSAS